MYLPDQMPHLADAAGAAWQAGGPSKLAVPVALKAGVQVRQAVHGLAGRPRPRRGGGPHETLVQARGGVRIALLHYWGRN